MAVARWDADTSSEAGRSESLPLVGGLPELTEREAAVLELVAAGLASNTIANRLFVSPQAVTYHIGNLLSKFQCENRAGLVARAFVLGVLGTSRWPPRRVTDAPGASRTRRGHPLSDGEGKD